jgi:hypothetical protein
VTDAPAISETADPFVFAEALEATAVPNDVSFIVVPKFVTPP